MLIPWNTDAPIYHWPYATVGLIVVCVLVFLAMLGANDETVTDWILWHGEGLHPLQWVTSNFIHDGFMHLAGNMIFLWGFGLVIEGKLGWQRFLAVFFGLGIVECAVEQLCALGMAKGGSFGASSILFGLMGMALVWAPKNEMSCLLLLGFRTITMELSILVFALIYLAWQVVMLCVDLFAFDEPLGTPALHLIGAVLGLALGVVMLKMDWVDCENWDIFALWGDHLGQEAGDQPRVKKKKQPPAEEAPPPEVTVAQREADRENAVRMFRELLSSGNIAGAQALLEKVQAMLPGWKLPEVDLVAWIKALHERRLWKESVPWMVDYLHRVPEKSARMRLKLAQILITQLDRPGQALCVLEKLPAAHLPPSLQETRDKLAAEATRMQDESASFEVGLEDW